jgi:hypothetical protein
VRVALAIGILVVILAAVVFAMRRRRVMPLDAPNAALTAELRRDVDTLCANGPRNTFRPAALAAAAAHVETELARAGYRVERQRYRIEEENVDADNLIVELRGASRPNEIVIIGAHYDSVDDSPGADDNASGTAGLLALARRFAHEKPQRTLRFVAFVNEEPPHFQTPLMGSLVYAKRCHERGETIVAMLSLESIGYYSDAEDSQVYPPPLSSLYPSTGNFLGFAGNIASRSLVMRSARAFRDATTLPAEAAVMPQLIQEIGWSDQWSFWQFGWPAIMVTDTAPFRNPHYHTAGDLPETLDYTRFALAVQGLEGVVRALVD